MLFLIGEKVAALYQRFQYTQVNFFIRPLALAKEGGMLILFAHDIDFRLAFMDGIVAPPAAQGSKRYRGISVQQKFPEVLPADFLKHLAHKVGKVGFEMWGPGRCF